MGKCKLPSGEGVTMSGGWRTLADGRRIFIPGASNYSAKRTAPQKKAAGIKKINLPANTYSSSSGYTTPNAMCPVCGATVFYYEHPNGARVFFDELGPPWPKHPCTSVHSSLSISQPRKIAEKPDWELKKWQPAFYIAHVVFAEGKKLRLKVKTEKQELIAEIEMSKLKHFFNLDKHIASYLFQVNVNGAVCKLQFNDGFYAFEANAKKPSTVSIPLSSIKAKRANKFIKGNSSIPFKRLKLTEVISTQDLGTSTKFNFKYLAHNYELTFTNKSLNKKLGKDWHNTKLKIYFCPPKKKSKNSGTAYIVSQDLAYISKPIPLNLKNKWCITQNLISNPAVDFTTPKFLRLEGTYRNKRIKSELRRNSKTAENLLIYLEGTISSELYLDSNSNLYSENQRLGKINIVTKYTSIKGSSYSTIENMIERKLSNTKNGSMAYSLKSALDISKKSTSPSA